MKKYTVFKSENRGRFLISAYDYYISENGTLNFIKKEGEIIYTTASFSQGYWENVVEGDVKFETEVQ